MWFYNSYFQEMQKKQLSLASDTVMELCWRLSVYITEIYGFWMDLESNLEMCISHLGNSSCVLHGNVKQV